MPLIDESWQDNLFAYIGGTVHVHNASILCSSGIEDHIHLRAKTYPSFAISDTSGEV